MAPSPLLAVLDGHGIPNAQRCRQIGREVVDRLSLDLSGLTVLTEAGSGAFALTPALAALGRATQVIAVTRDSRYGSGDANRLAALTFADYAGVLDKISVVPAVGRAEIAASDIVTNLGFVRPIDARTIAAMKPTAVIPLMCESWEVRSEDVDLDACRRHGIVALGTNEDHPNVRVFHYCGMLAVRLLFEAGFEVLGTQVVVVGRDRFAPVIASALDRAGSRVQLVTALDSKAVLAAVEGADVLMLADYSDTTVFIGDDGVVSPADLAAACPGLTIVQFAGGVDARSIRARGLTIWPEQPVGPRRMAHTLAYLGPRPVVTLHAAGLKVGEMAARARLSGLDPRATIAFVCGSSTMAQAPL